MIFEGGTLTGAVNEGGILNAGEFWVAQDSPFALFEDLTGDGTRDLLIGCRHADSNGVSQSGGLYFWRAAVVSRVSSAHLLALAVPGAMGGDQVIGTVPRQMTTDSITRAE